MAFYEVTFTATPAEVKAALEQANQLAAAAMDQRRQMAAEHPEILKARLAAYEAQVRAELDTLISEKDQIISAQHQIGYDASRTLTMMYEHEAPGVPFDEWFDSLT